MKTILFICLFILFVLTNFGQDLFSPNYSILKVNGVAPISLDNTNTFAYPTGNGAWTFSYTQGTVNNGYALLFITGKNNTSSTYTISGVTYDSIAMNFITNYAGFDGSSTHTIIYVYGVPIANDASGSKIVGATVSTSPSTHFSGKAMVSVWNNVNQSATPATKVSARAFAASATVTMTTVNGGAMASAVIFETSGNVSAVTGFPLSSSLWSQGTNTTATSTALGYTFSPSDDFGDVGVVLSQ